MGIFKRFINKIRFFFERKQITNKHRYELEAPKDDDLARCSNLKDDDACMEGSYYTDNLSFDPVSIDNEKSSFFKMYEAYKKGKIKPENMLITDLINMEIFMQHELELLNTQVKLKSDEVNNQEETLKKLIEEENELEEKIKQYT